MEVTGIGAARREQIIDAAFELYGEKGIDHTSVKDVAERAGITRSLFYHYFDGKEDVTDAILDRYVKGFVARVHEWNDSRVERDVRGALVSCVDMLRELMLGRDTVRDLLLKPENAALYLRFSQRSAEAVARYLTDTTAVAYVEFHKLEIKHVYESFYLLIFGLIGYVRTNPDAPSDLLADLIADTLHLDLSES